MHSKATIRILTARSSSSAARLMRVILSGDGQLSHMPASSIARRTSCSHLIPVSSRDTLPIIQSDNTSRSCSARFNFFCPLQDSVDWLVCTVMVMMTLLESRMRFNKPNSSITSKKERTVALCQCHSDERSETVTWHWLG